MGEKNKAKTGYLEDIMLFFFLNGGFLLKERPRI